MDEWNTTYQNNLKFRHHTKSGLYQQCLDSKMTVEEAENQIIKFLKDKGFTGG